MSGVAVDGSPRHFAVSILPAGATTLVDVFGGKTDLKGADRFKVDDWRPLTTGAPIYKRALAALDCKLETLLAYGRTTIVVGHVVDLYIGGGDPLLYFRGQYRSLL